MSEVQAQQKEKKHTHKSTVLKMNGRKNEERLSIITDMF